MVKLTDVPWWDVWPDEGEAREQDHLQKHEQV